MEASGQLHAPTALPPGKEATAPIGWEARWAPELDWKLWRKENLVLPGIEPGPSNP
jgi:hypothetical protein